MRRKKYQKSIMEWYVQIASLAKCFYHLQFLRGRDSFNPAFLLERLALCVPITLLRIFSLRLNSCLSGTHYFLHPLHTFLAQCRTFLSAAFTWHLDLIYHIPLFSCLSIFFCVINVFPFLFPFATLVWNVKFITTWNFRKHLSRTITHDMTVGF